MCSLKYRTPLEKGNYSGSGLNPFFANLNVFEATVME